ncbi:PspC domain-containing protein [Mariniluteicoccus flavus]
MDLTTLRRSAAPDAKAAGVCAGLAASWRIDPLVLRIVCVVLALGGGVGIVLYAAAWLALPKQGSDRSHLDGVFPGWRQWPPVAVGAVLVVASLLVSAALGAILPFGVTPSLVVLAVWYFGFHRPRRAAAADRSGHSREHTSVTATTSSPFAQETEFTQLAAAWQARVHDHLARSGQMPPPPPRTPGVELQSGRTQEPAYATHPGYSLEAFLAAPDPVGLYAEPTTLATSTGASVEPTTRARRTNRRLAWLGLTAMGAALGAVGVVDIFRVVPFEAYPAAALLVVGLALLAGTRFGRPRGFVALGVVLALTTLGGLADRSNHSPSAATMITAVAPSDIPVEVIRNRGPVDIDLSAVTLTEDRTMTAKVDVGHLHIKVPQNARVRVDYSTDVGHASILGRTHEGGVDVKGTTVDDPSPTGPLLTIVAHVDAGQLVIER